jgi:hypothetical protein
MQHLQDGKIQHITSGELWMEKSWKRTRCPMPIIHQKKKGRDEDIIAPQSREKRLS